MMEASRRLLLRGLPRNAWQPALAAVALAAVVLSVAGPAVCAEKTEPAPQAALGVLVARTAEGEGVRVMAVEPNSPAEKAGVRPGDRIVTADGKNIAAPSELIGLIREKKPGEKVKITFFREGEKETVTAELGKARQLRQWAVPEQVQRWFEQREGRPGRAFLGVLLEETSGPGARIAEVEPKSPASAAGLKSGDVLLAINGKKVASPENARTILDGMEPGRKVELRVARDGKETNLTATLGRPAGMMPGGFGPPMSMPPMHSAMVEKIERLEAQNQQLRKEVDTLRKDVAELKKQLAEERSHAAPATPKKKPRVRT